MAFFEREFPRQVSEGAQGGPNFYTTVNTGFSGYEQRNKNWAASLAEWSIVVMGQQNPTSSALTDFDLVRNFHYVVGGQGDAFRFFDHTDHSAVAQTIGVGDGANKTFQLQKTYASGDRSYVYTVKKPIIGATLDYQNVALGTDTVVVYDNGSQQTHHASTYAVDGTKQYSLDPTTGIVTFVAAPAVGHIITADFWFHYAVRFKSDMFKANILAKTQSVNTIASVSIDLIEVRLQ